jgi:hypothetical protein
LILSPYTVLVEKLPLLSGALIGSSIALLISIVYYGIEFNLARYSIAQRRGWDYIGTGTNLPS